MRQRSFWRFIRVLLFFLVFLSIVRVTEAQETRVSRRKIEREHAKKEKESRKAYEQAVKQHRKNQSANTKAMMKQSKKMAPKKTPVKPASGKKCK